MSPTESPPINGNPAALAFDRAVDELRRGRAIQVVDGTGTRGVVAAAIETLQEPLLAHLVAANAGHTTVFVTAERALAAGISRQLGGPVTIGCPPGTRLAALHALAGVVGTAAVDGGAFDVNGAPEHSQLIAGALQLAKAGQLVPALVGFTTSGQTTDGVLMVRADDVATHAPRFGHHALQLLSRARVPLADAVDSEIAVFRDEHSLSEHIAVVIGKLDQTDAVPVRLHSACLTGDLLGSLRCDCGEQLRTAVARIAALGGGVLLYLDQEGRGIGLPNKLRAYVLQDSGLDTLDADQHLGFSSDERTYDVAAALLHEIGVTRIRLLTNNPQKISSLREHGIDVVGRLPLVTSSNAHNERYLRAKHERAGHLDLAEQSKSG